MSSQLSKRRARLPENPPKLVPHSKVVPTDYLDDYAGEDDETPEETAASFRRTAARAKARREQS